MAEILGYSAKSIAPAGRNKYGRYYAAGNITKSVINTTYGGNNTTTTIGETGTTEESNDNVSFYCLLLKPNMTFTGLELAEGAHDTTDVVAYKGFEKAATLICDLGAVSAETDGDMVISLTAPPNSGITNIPTGMAITVTNNGTSAATINVYADTDLTGSTGTIKIPVVIYKRNTAIPVGDDLYDWWDSQNDCEQVWLDLTWNVNRNGASTYVLDLSNERAGVNCDSAGTIYTASTATLTCTATTYYGTEVVQGATYSISIQPRYNAVGVSISQSTGVLQWASNFSFTGPNLPIDVIASVDGNPVATKTMSIDKNYPGPDGSPAVTRWIVTDYDVVTYNPNTRTLYPNAVQAWVMKQEGGDEPVRDTATTIYYGYDTTTPTQPLPSTGAAAYNTVSAITFALKTSSNVYYEIETVPILWAGENGTDGVDGSDGEDGADGESAYYLTLSNDNASINADADGNILPYAIKPTCKTKLYYGSTRITNATYTIDAGTATGVSITTSNGIGTINFADNFNFTGDTLEISVSGISDNTLRDVKIMNVTKAKAGAEGEPAVSYWLSINYGEIIYNPNTHAFSPSAISGTAYQQRGEEAFIPSPATETTIKYKWQYLSTGDWTSETTYTRGSNITITSAICENYRRLRFILYKGTSQLDQEDVDIMRDGADGAPGQGRTGAAIRGPYDYATNSASTRCWCAGVSSSTCDDCDKWIDVVLCGDTYYYCNTTYYGTLASHFPGYWTSGDSFDFVAAKLILAPNASIDFMTNNELYLRDSNGNITAGAAGGNGINFWAGASSPGNASFTVNNDGTMVAKKGTFGTFTIGTDDLSRSSLNASGTSYDGDSNLVKDELSLSSQLVSLYSSAATGNATQIYLSATENDVYKDLANATFDIKYSGGKTNDWRETKAIETNGTISGTRFIGKRGTAVTSFPDDIEVIFTTSSSTMFQKTGYWHINGYNTNIPYTSPGSLFHKVGSWWWYGTENTKIPVSAPSGPSDHFTSGSSEETWTFNGSDLNIPYMGSYVSFNESHNAWLVGNSPSYNTGIQHPLSGITTPNAIYKDMEPPATRAASCPSQGMGSLVGFYDRGTFGEVAIERGSSTGSGYVVLQLASAGQHLTAYTRCSWLEVTSVSASGITPTLSLKVTGSYGGTRYGFVELFDDKVLIGRVVIKQTAE